MRLLLSTVQCTLTVLFGPEVSCVSSRRHGGFSNAHVGLP